ncbi:MAG: hypothetical protein MK437_05725 [SAR324 cluster bacterium]|nr:hypothetical protein [SAR324 cluster bacterium]
MVTQQAKRILPWRTISIDLELAGDRHIPKTAVIKVAAGRLLLGEFKIESADTGFIEDDLPGIV